MSSELFMIVIIIVAVIVLMSLFVFFFAPKLRKRILGEQLKSMRSMFEDNKSDLTKLGSMGIEIKKQLLEENEESLTDIAHKEAKIRSVGIKSAAKSFKEGLKETDAIYCKYCGSEIDSGSIFCKKCGKEQ